MGPCTPRKKDGCIVLYDLNTEPKDLAKKTLLKIFCKKYFMQSKDVVHVIFMNTKATKNKLNARSKGYEHISEASEKAVEYQPDVMLQWIESTESSTDANWLEALEVAVDSIAEQFGDSKEIVNIQLLFITDLSNEISIAADDTKLQTIVARLQKDNIFFYIVGPDVRPLSAIASIADIKEWTQSFEPSEETCNNLNFAKRIVKNARNGVICGFKLGRQLFWAYKCGKGSQLWKVPLAMGTMVAFPSITMKVLEPGLVCKMVDQGSCSKETVWIRTEDETVEVDFSEVKRGISLHGKFVEIFDNNVFKCDNPKDFSIQCFTKKSNVPEYLFCGGRGYRVYAGETPEARQSFNYLVQSTAEKDLYAIARRVYNKNFAPQFVALIPKPDCRPMYFSLVFLPNADDIIVSYKEKPLSLAPQVEVPKAVCEYLDSMDVKNLPIGVNMMQDITVDKIVNKAADKLLEKHLDLQEVEFNLFDQSLLNVDAAKITTSWPERELPEAAAEEESDSEDDLN